MKIHLVENMDEVLKIVLTRELPPKPTGAPARPAASEDAKRRPRPGRRPKKGGGRNASRAPPNPLRRGEP